MADLRPSRRFGQNLRRILRFTIVKAEVEMKFKRAEQSLEVYGLEFKQDIKTLKRKSPRIRAIQTNSQRLDAAQRAGI